MSTPEDILIKIRRSLGLDENDTSRDKEIERFTPMSKLRLVMEWQFGDPDWADIFIIYAKRCGIKIDA